MDLKSWLRAQWDRVLAAAFASLGALALLLGWLGVDDALYPGQQIPYVLSGGIGGLLAVGVGAVLWLSADLRDEWRKLDQIDEKLGRLLEQQATAAVAPRETSVLGPEPAPAPPRAARRKRPSAGGSTNGAPRSRSRT